MLEEDLSRLEVGESIYYSCEKGYCFWGVSLVKCLFIGDLEGIGLLIECESKYFFFKFMCSNCKYDFNYWLIIIVI